MQPFRRFEDQSTILLTTTPHDNGPVGISRQDVSVLSESQTRHILWTVAGRFEYPIALVQGVAGVQSPEANVTLAASDDLITF